MKKILAITLAILIGVMSFALAGCGKTDTTDNKETEKPTAADSDLAYVKEKGKLVIGITDWAPMDYKENGEWVGFDVEYGKAVCAKLGVTPEFKEIEWNSKEMSLKTKEIDCIWNGMTITDAIMAAADVTGAYMYNYQVIVVKDNKTFNSIASLEGKTVVAEQGSAGETAAKEDAVLSKNYKPVRAQSDALLQVKSGQADACVIDHIMADEMLAEGKSYSDLSTIESVKLGEESYGIAFRTGSDIVAEVDKITAELFTNGTMKQIADKYDVTESLVQSFVAGENK
ncbi:MAG: transporter substrate-binding domain-containing protein [Clostridia bacterium]|nr:transporter substrate-binding domain-containing protein [Clostridia bacterium]